MARDLAWRHQSARNGEQPWRRGGNGVMAYNKSRNAASNQQWRGMADHGVAASACRHQAAVINIAAESENVAKLSA
jgi:hypothetical protein